LAVRAASSAGAAVRTYWTTSRAPRYSIVFALPLLLLYEGLAAAVGDAPGAAHVRNAADVALKTPFYLLSGARGSIAFFATTIGVCIFLIARDLKRSKQPLRPRTFVLMLGESAVLAALLGVVVGTITRELLGALSAHVQFAIQSGRGVADPQPLAAMGAGTKLMLALGAGLYEELLFRVLLVGGIAAAFAWLAGGRNWLTNTVAAVVGALIFSAFHYVGQYGDKLELASFLYRTIAGLAFSGLYLTRGFGITAWTHALYDVYVMLL
jgi:hypothetical protein